MAHSDHAKGIRPTSCTQPSSRQGVLPKNRYGTVDAGGMETGAQTVETRGRGILPCVGRFGGRRNGVTPKRSIRLEGRTGSVDPRGRLTGDRKSTRLNSSHGYISYAVFCLKKKNE